MRRISITIFVLAMGLTCVLAFQRFQRGQPALRDFVSFYSGAHLLREAGQSAELYSLPSQVRVQSSVAPNVRYMPFLRPPVDAALFTPLSLLPLPAAAATWLALNAAAAFLVGLWCVRRMKEPAVFLLLSFYVPLIVGFNMGQDAPLLTLAVVCCFELIERGQPSTAGILLALLWVKPHWLPPLLLLLSARRQWKALGVFAGLSAALWAVFPPAPWIRFVWEVRNDVRVADCVRCMPNLRGLLLPTPVLIVGTAAVFAVLVVFAARAPLASAFALACAAILLTGYHTHLYDCVVLAPAIAAGSAGLKHPAQKAVLGIALSPLPWLAFYWNEYLRIVPALTVIAVFIALAFRGYTSDANTASP